MLNRNIKKVAVLGSGVMGSRIACHFAGVGLDVLLLDIATPVKEGEAEQPKNKWVNEHLQNAIKSNPSPLFLPEFSQKITTGNFDEDLPKIKNCDWIIEVVVERLDIKQQLFEKVELHRTPGTLITSNTSGIPISMMANGRSEDFKKHFCGTHFFNPPRYLKLLEIIPTKFTDESVVKFFLNYGDKVLGKTTVLCKDTPAFIANRVGVFSIMAIFHTMQKMGLSIDQVEALTGPIIGRPKSATFRTADVVGIDTLVKVANGVGQNCPNDEAKHIFDIPTWLQKILDNNWLGDKTGQGFFKKNKTATGEKSIDTLNLETLEYGPQKREKFASVDAAKQIENLAQRIKTLVNAPDTAGQFLKTFHQQLFSYISFRIPEISDELYRLDDAMMAGFGWEIGAFETWDALGVAKFTEEIKANNIAVAPWVNEMIEAGNKSFYKVENGQKLYYDIATKTYKQIEGGSAFIVMKNFEHQTIWKNDVCRTYHLGGDVLGLEWYTKMGSIGGEVLEGIQKSIILAEEKYKGLVIANDGPNFSAGANVGMIFMLALEQDYDEIEMAVMQFQNTIMRVRYSNIPVVVAPHGLALGGACEMSLHADAVVAAAETYCGLVEVGIGVIPGGAGTKEFALRAFDEMHDGEPDANTLQKRFINIATAKVGTSAHEAFNLGIYRKGIDIIAHNGARRIDMAKTKVIELFDKGYVMPTQRTNIKVLGKQGLGTLLAGVHGMKTAGYATEHDSLIAKKLAYVMCGGDLSEHSFVSEQYLLDIEREAFLQLCGEKKTLERIQSVLKTGKPLRN